MDLCHNVEGTVEKLEQGVSFTEHILNNGSALQLMLMKKVVSQRMFGLISNNQSPDFSVNIQFETDRQAFEDALKKTFGHLKKDEEVKVLTFFF